MQSSFTNKTLYLVFISILLAGGSFFLGEVPRVFGYAQGSYYSQGTYYSQTYYQTYYQSTYGIDFTTDVVMQSTLFVTGGVAKGSGSFLIDHPLDPANKLLYHSFVESPDVKNIYDGVATLDSKGEAIINLPDYFEVLNKDYRYQAKGLSAPAPNLFIKSEVKDNQFTIAGGPAGATISWQITGIRQDPYIIANPIINEVEKGTDQVVDKGEYLFEGYESSGQLTKMADTLWSKIKGFFAGFWSLVVNLIKG